MARHSRSRPRPAVSQRGVRALDLFLWAVQVVMAAVFLFSGANKFDAGGPVWTAVLGTAGAPFWIDVFAKIGLGQWFRYFTGGLEVLCGFLLLVPRTSGYAAGILACTMLGAVLTHLFVLHDSLALPSSAWS